MTGSKTGPRIVPSDHSHRGHPRDPRGHEEEDAEIARREAQAFLEETGRKASPAAAKGGGVKERRHSNAFAVIERRKGTGWLVGQVVVLGVLAGYLACSLAK